MPSRIIREGIISSGRVNALSAGAEILYRRLINVADDYGRYYASPITVRGACWPTCPEKVTEGEVASWLMECTEGDKPLIVIYESGGAKYLLITEFGQQVRSKSKFPVPPAVHDISAREFLQQSQGKGDTECEANDITYTADTDSTIRISKAKAKAKAKASINLRASDDAPESVLPALTLVVGPPVYGKAWFDRQHDAWYDGAYWRKVNRKASRVQYELAVKRLVAGGKAHEEAAQFLFEEAIKDRERFEPTEDWQWRRNLHPERWLKKDRWGDDAGCPPLVAPGRTPTANEIRRAETIRGMELFEQLREAENVR